MNKLIKFGLVAVVGVTLNYNSYSYAMEQSLEVADDLVSAKTINVAKQDHKAKHFKRNRSKVNRVKHSTPDHSKHKMHKSHKKAKHHKSHKHHSKQILNQKNK